MLDEHDHGDQVYARVRVEDTGGGIPEEDLCKVFAPFFTTKNHGTGLGLSIVSRIVQNHGGSLRAANGAHGAVFTVLLPLADCLDD
jgi:signal transduction histidine kinase